jgi:CheY-like chemotaxis protein
MSILHIVLAEDDPDIQLVARLALKGASFDVTVANDGVEALARIGERRPDVVLLDWMMPKMDGAETCRHLKADAATRNIPVIFLTAKSQQSEIAHGVSLGAIGYITKPFDALTLATTVRDLLNAAIDPPTGRCGSNDTARCATVNPLRGERSGS